jgi:hypothetical protein
MFDIIIYCYKYYIILIIFYYDVRFDYVCSILFYLQDIIVTILGNLVLLVVNYQLPQHYVGPPEEAWSFQSSTSLVESQLFSIS